MKFRLVESSEYAYMIRNDKKVFQMKQHVYGGGSEDYEETCFAAEWLYKHTQYSKVKQDCLDFIAAYGDFMCTSDIAFGKEESTGEERKDYLLSLIHRVPYRFLSEDFVKSLDPAQLSNLVDIDDYNRLVNEELNQEFLRARYGGMYNSQNFSKEMVFRVSSKGFNWFDIIWEFVYDNRNSIDCVTIVRDEESTGKSDVYSYRGEKFSAMPIDEFINLSGRPVVESIKKKHPYVLSSRSASEQRQNLGRYLERWYRQRYHEPLTF